ncbi:MAG: hypothetical protein ABIM30_00670 [candidate division WOR-3 bacterium]
MTELEIIVRDIEHIKRNTEGLADKINNLTLEVAKTSTRLEMLTNAIEDQERNLLKHEKECPARRDAEEIRKQFISFSIKLLISYLALAIASVSAYGAIQKLF